MVLSDREPADGIEMGFKDLRSSHGGSKGSSTLTLLAVLVAFSLLASCFAFAVSATAANADERVDADQGSSATSTFDYEDAMSFFVANEGQFDGAIKFVAVTEFGQAAFYDSMVQYCVKDHQDGELVSSDVITLTFPGSSQVVPEGQDLLAHKSNYLLGDDQSAWISGADNFGAIVYQDLWPGVDLSYRFSDDGLKYEFSVEAFVPQDLIEVKVSGASVRCDDSSLILDTGNACLADGGLLVTQGAASERLPALFKVTGEGYSFAVQGRDLSKTLLIDPLVYSTYLGGSAADMGISVSVDVSGMYVTGQTSSTNFPTSHAVFASNRGGQDVFILKLNAAGTALVYSTYFGGNSNDVAVGIAADAAGTVFVAGYTASTNFPTDTPRQAANAGMNDIFLLRLNQTGADVIFSTYWGGSSDDIAGSIALCPCGTCGVAGYTSSTDFPTVNAYQSNNSGGIDAFLFRVNPNGSLVAFSTYFGGSGNDFAFGAVFDGTFDSVYITGETSSGDLTTMNPFQGSLAGESDVFVTKFDYYGGLLYSTYVGGAAYEGGLGITVDSNLNAYVTGVTRSSDFPTLVPYQSAYAGVDDAFVMKLNATGNGLLYSTYLGGAYEDVGNEIAVDGSGNAYVAGYTNSSDFPTVDPIQAAKAGSLDAFVFKLDAIGSTCLSSTYIGGSDDDIGEGIAVDASGNTYVTGLTWSSDFPTVNPYQGARAGQTDVFLLKMGISSLPSSPLNLQADASSGYVTLTWDEPADNGGASIINYKIYRGGSPGGETYLATVGNVTTYNDTSVAHQMYYYKVSALNPAGEGALSGEAGPVTPFAAPGAPTGLTATPGEGQIVLEWLAPLNDGGQAVTNYTVHRGASPGTETYLATVGNVLTYTDLSVGSGTYYYKVAAVNSVGEGAKSNEAGPVAPLSVPSAPSGLTAIVGNGQVALNWSAPASSGGSSITGYNIYRGTTSGGETLLERIGVTLNYTDTDLTNGVTYYYRVSANNSLGEGAESDEVSITPAGVPSAPTLNTATPGDGYVVLAWTAPNSGGSAITNYSVYRSNVSGGEALLITLGDVLTWNDTGLTNGQTYYYKVSATNAQGESMLSNELNATPAVAPSAPVLDSAVAGAEQAALSWSAPASDGGSAIINYKVYRGNASGNLTLVATLDDVLAYNDTGLTDGQVYYYRISAVNLVGESALSNELNVTPGAVPSEPIGLRGLAGDSQVSLNWSAPAYVGPGTVTYHLFRDGALLWSGANLTYDDTGLVNGVNYSYKVAAQNTIGWGPNSSEVLAIPGGEAPSAPQNLTAAGGMGQVVLIWEAPASSGTSAITGYNVYRGLSPGNETLIEALGDVLTYTDSGLAEGTYYYVVRAVSPAGESMAAEASTVVQTGDAPSAPGNLIAQAFDGYVVLTWEAPASAGASNITRYDVYQSVNYWDIGSVIGNVPAATLTYNDTDVLNDMAYYYVVKAVSAVGASNASNQASATPSLTGTAPGAPVSLDVSGQADSILLVWSPPANAGSGVANYLIFRTTSSGGQGATPLAAVPGGVLSYEDSSVTVGTEYFYIVKANNSYGLSPASEENSAVATVTPTVPQSFEASASDGQISLEWAAPSGSGLSPITGYNIYRGATADSLSLLANTTGTSFVDDSAEPGQTYYYQVRAVNDQGEGAPTLATMVSLPFAAPSAPRNLTAAAGVGKVTLSWLAPSDDGGSNITAYKVYRKTGTENFTLLTTLGANVTSYEDATGAAGTAYTYLVKAVNAAGDGADSNQASATPQSSDDSWIYLVIAAAVLAVLAGAAYYLLVWRKKEAGEKK